MNNGEEDTGTVKKRVNFVWHYCEQLNNSRVRCRLCNYEQNFNGATGNILKHLYKKHNIDDKENQSQCNTMTSSAIVENNISKMAQLAKPQSYKDFPDLDPYTDEVTEIRNYVDSVDVDCNNINYKIEELTPDEERIAAEIEYFREKAEFYRMQKALVAIRAQKAKRELEIMIAAHLQT